jgi:hypothetical protein
MSARRVTEDDRPYCGRPASPADRHRISRRSPRFSRPRRAPFPPREMLWKALKKQSFLTLFSCRFIVDKAWKGGIIEDGINIEV